MPEVVRCQFKQVQHRTGTLVAVEGDRDVPFTIRRTYYLFDVPPEEVRGAHAHRTLRQVAVCARGSCRMRLDDGIDSIDLVMNRPNEGLVLEPMVWHQMWDFSADCLFLVVADAPYDESDYIRDYAEFKRAVRR